MKNLSQQMLKPQMGIHSSIFYILPSGKKKKSKAVQHQNQSETSERSDN